MLGVFCSIGNMRPLDSTQKMYILTSTVYVFVFVEYIYLKYESIKQANNNTSIRGLFKCKVCRCKICAV